jgi:diphosphomevalonate decarboxylase
VTIDPDTMCSRTTITASPAFAANTMSLNGKEEDFDGNVRLCNVVREMRKIAGDYVGADGAVVVKKEDWATYKLKVVSHNNFPTAAGLASSASGYACFTKCLAEVFAVRSGMQVCTRM